MKITKNKYIKCFIFMLTILSAFLSIQKVNAETYSGQAIWPSEYISNVYIKKVRSDGYIKYQQGRFIRRSEDNKFVYCLQPYVDINNNYIYNIARSDYASVLGLSQAQWERASLLAYYGYGYGNHTEHKWYAITQVMIWRTVEPTSQIFFTDTLNGNRNDNLFASEIAELERLVANHYKAPNFNTTDITIPLGQSITLTDSNGVLSNYKVKSASNVSATINGNTLTITATDIGDAKIKLIKEDTKHNMPPVVYYKENTQNVFRVGSYDPISFNLNMTIIGGRVEITKRDSATGDIKPQGDASLVGAVYGVYDSETDELITKLTTDENSYAISDYLPKLGNFYLKEITPSKGYLLDTKKYPFTLDKDTLLLNVDVYEDVITRTFEFTKVYASDKTGIMTPEVGVEFAIYDSNNNLVIKEKTNNEGKIYITLPYGKYTLKQLTTTKDHEYMEDYNFEVVELGETNKVFANAPIEAKLKVIKVDAETGNVITRSNIKFKIFNVDTGKYVSQTITYPTAGTIDVFETDSNGILITPYPLTCGTYRLEEVDQVIDGYLWNKESVEFHIGENAEFITDNEYGVLFEVKFKNTPVKGLVEITKTGESVELTENGYIYTKINLSGVKIGLYANEDIYDNFKNLIYQKNDLVKEIITDENGYAKVDNLFLGKYFLKEIETVNNHILNENKYEFELKYKDQYTSVIKYETIIENHLPKGTLEFTKTDFSTSQTLPNTKIEIYTNDENNNLVYSGYTDENGKIIITELPVGKYYILETEAPSGYELNTEKMEFEILNNGDVIKCTMTNELVITDVPNTEENQFPVFELLSLCICALGLGVVAYAKKKKSK